MVSLLTKRTNLSRLLIILILIGLMLIPTFGTAFAAEGGGEAAAVDTETAVSGDDAALGLSPIAFFFIIFAICTVIGMIAVLGGVGGGVVFTPLFMGFTPIDSFIIRATGLFVAMCGALVAARPFLRKGLANIRILMFAAVPYAVFAVIGALMAGWIDQNMGATGDALIKLSLGILVIGIGGLIFFGGSKVEYPDVRGVDSFTERIKLSMSYWEESLGKVVHYKVKRAPIGILLFCFVGLISGLFGLGAGWAMVPVFNLVMLAPLKVAAACSKVLIGIGDTAAVWPYIKHGGIFPLFAVPSMMGLVLGTVLGAKVMLRIKAGPIRYLIIVIMIFSGIKLVIDGIGGM
ncbi:MAG: sulfite exporter TauE/SafE family protein [Dehalococcoidia bacterium]